MNGKPKIKGQVFFKNEEYLLSVVQDTGLYGKERGYWFYNCALKPLLLDTEWYTEFFEFHTEMEFEEYIKKNNFSKQVQKLN